MHRIREEFPFEVEIAENTYIPLSDGCKLAAKIWRPISNPKVPAILEFIPYGKRFGTHVRDQLNHPYFAGHGFACIRVDCRGFGESEGLFEDEYSKQEHKDVIEVIKWIANQSWCNSNIGIGLQLTFFIHSQL